MKQLNKLIESIKEKISPEPEFDPWGNPIKPTPQITEEDIEEAIEKMKQPKPSFPWWRVESLFIILWGLAHFVLLYAMIGSPISGGILVYVLINLAIFTRHLLTLGKVNKK